MRKKRAFTLIELLVVVAIIALLIAILLPSLSRARELSKRVTCSANLRGIGLACSLYSADNYDQWPLVPFDTDQINPGDGITYVGEIHENPNNEPDVPRYEVSRTQQDEDSGDGDASTKVSTTRCFWMLVRNSMVIQKEFICPSSDDTPDDTNEIARYYDFYGLWNISYGLQVPYGKAASRPYNDADGRLILAADKGPFSSSLHPAPREPNGESEWPGSFDMLDANTAPNLWKASNSPNHGGEGSGEGQNVLFPDVHVEFKRKPIVGIDEDNIYTLMTGVEYIDRWLGGSPISNDVAPLAAYPGQGAFASGSRDATTDCLIYP